MIILFISLLSILLCQIEGFSSSHWRQKPVLQFSHRCLQSPDRFQLDPLHSSISTNSIDDDGVSTNNTSSIRITNLSPPKLLEEKSKSSFWKSFGTALQQNWLVLGEIFVIALAQINPSLGVTGGPLKPELFVSKIGNWIKALLIA